MQYSRKNFSPEDLSIIQCCHEHHLWNSVQIAREHADKGWKQLSRKQVLQRFKKTGSAKQGPNGGAVKKRTKYVEPVKQILEGSSGVAALGCSLREISEKAGAPRTTVQRIMKEDLRLKSLGQVACQNLTEKQNQKRLDFCVELLQQLDSGEVSLDNIVFSDEATVRCSTTKVVTRNARVWVGKEKLKKTYRRLSFQNLRLGFQWALWCTFAYPALVKFALAFVLKMRRCLPIATSK